MFRTGIPDLPRVNTTREHMRVSIMHQIAMARGEGVVVPGIGVSVFNGFVARCSAGHMHFVSGSVLYSIDPKDEHTYKGWSSTKCHCGAEMTPVDLADMERWIALYDAAADHGYGGLRALEKALAEASRAVPS